MWGPLDPVGAGPPEAAARAPCDLTRPGQGRAPSSYKCTAGLGASQHLEPKQQRGGQMWRQAAQTVLQVRHLVSSEDSQDQDGSIPNSQGSWPALGGQSVP